MSGTDLGCGATRCLVLMSGMGLRVGGCILLRSAGKSMRRIRTLPPYGTARRIILRAPYAVSGTDVGYAAPPGRRVSSRRGPMAMLLPGSNLVHRLFFRRTSLRCYAAATRCPVLTLRMLLPGPHLLALRHAKRGPTHVSVVFSLARYARPGIDAARTICYAILYGVPGTDFAYLPTSRSLWPSSLSLGARAYKAAASGTNLGCTVLRSRSAVRHSSGSTDSAGCSATARERYYAPMLCTYPPTCPGSEPVLMWRYSSGPGTVCGRCVAPGPTVAGLRRSAREPGTLSLPPTRCPVPCYIGCFTRLERSYSTEVQYQAVTESAVRLVPGGSTDDARLLPRGYAPSLYGPPDLDLELSTLSARTSPLSARRVGGTDGGYLLHNRHSKRRTVTHMVAQDQ
eukprot:2033081-Rhodomonas_salina.3